MPLTLSIGSGPIALVQAGTVTETLQLPPGSTGPLAGTLPVASTAGTTLLATLSGTIGSIGLTATFPPGWVQVAANSTTDRVEAWIYPNNPGGISSIAVQVLSNPSLTLTYYIAVSEWANVYLIAATIDTSGIASATSGTTLALATTGNVAATGEVAIAAWLQAATPSGAVIFTTPGGWTRLADNGSDAASNVHVDSEYQPNPSSGSPLSVTLTSNRTTLGAGGVLLVLKPAPLATDQTSMLQYGTVTIKGNTADFSLIDPADG